MCTRIACMPVLWHRCHSFLFVAFFSSLSYSEMRFRVSMSLRGSGGAFVLPVPLDHLNRQQTRLQSHSQPLVVWVGENLTNEIPRKGELCKLPFSSIPINKPPCLTGLRWINQSLCFELRVTGALRLRAVSATHPLLIVAVVSI